MKLPDSSKSLSDILGAVHLFGLRALLKPKNIVICISGCKLYFFCSNIGRQMSEGRVSYIVEMSEKGANKIRNFDDCNDTSKPAKVEQKITYIKK